MWSWVPQKGRRGAISHRAVLLLLVLVITAKPEDIYGSRSDGGSRVPDKQRWWYQCTVAGCKRVKKFDKKPTVAAPYCTRHQTNVAMKLIHNPEKD